MESASDHTDIPAEIRDKLASLDDALSDVEKNLDPLLKTPLSEMGKLQPLDRAKMDLVAAYAINSLFWVYLNINGINPKEHPIKQELDRMRGYMGRIKEIQDKAKAPKLDVGASKRFVRNALWQSALHKAIPMHESEQQAGKETEEKTSSNEIQPNTKGDNPETHQSKSSLWKAAQGKRSTPTHKNTIDSSPKKRVSEETETSNNSKKKKSKKSR